MAVLESDQPTIPVCLRQSRWNSVVPIGIASFALGCLALFNKKTHTHPVHEITANHEVFSTFPGPGKAITSTTNRKPKSSC
jgi:hypothetical protein